MKRFLLRISYDGTNFNGWQSQKKGTTIQQVIETALSGIAKTSVSIVGSGRTDAGVHAIRQYAHFDFPIDMDTEQIRLALLSKLPADILVGKVVAVNDDFHARFDARERKYRYIIAKEKNPFNRLYKAYFPRKNISLTSMRECAVYFLGKQDFTSFSKHNPDLKNNFCTIKKFEVIQEKSDLNIEITANRFLHNMVRRIAGTLVNISHSKTNPGIISKLIDNKDPGSKLISTAPACGLYLIDVLYPGLVF
ncbi:MAG: tRNA pseudouridine(38-40) synthase TruA [Candidatus Cloacimonetes bacterium]|nr:tRNA pseudouridine(38-40) synthase TruA [Candidatus Cloacimonadota bacterium]